MSSLTKYPCLHAEREEVNISLSKRLLQKLLMLRMQTEDPDPAATVSVERHCFQQCVAGGGGRVVLLM